MIDRYLRGLIALCALVVFGAGYALGTRTSTANEIARAEEVRLTHAVCIAAVRSAERAGAVTLVVQETLRAIREERAEAAESWEVDG